MKKLRRVSLFVVFLCAQTSMQAIPTSSDYAIAGAVALASGVVAHLTSTLPKKIGLNTDTVWFAIPTAIVSGLAYYVAHKYTPEGKFDWSLDVNTRIKRNGLSDKKFASKEELEAHCKKQFVRRGFPVVQAYNMINGQYADASDALVYLDEAASEKEDDGFDQKVENLKKDLRKQKEDLYAKLLMVKELPYFVDHLHRSQMLEIEKRKLHAQQTIAWNSYR